MRLLAFSLGRGITDRISRIAGHGSAVACPTLQRLSTAGFHEDDIVIAKASSLIRESLRATIGSRSIIAIMDDEIPLEGVVRIGEDFSDFELLEAVETASAERGVHSSIREGMAGSSDVMKRTRRLMQRASMSTLRLPRQRHCGQHPLRAYEGSLLERFGRKGRHTRRRRWIDALP